jgi:hypothetical protein
VTSGRSQPGNPWACSERGCSSVGPSGVIRDGSSGVIRSGPSRGKPGPVRSGRPRVGFIQGGRPPGRRLLDGAPAGTCGRVRAGGPYGAELSTRVPRAAEEGVDAMGTSPRAHVRARARSATARRAGPVVPRLPAPAVGLEPDRVRVLVVVPPGDDDHGAFRATLRLRPGARTGCHDGHMRHPKGGARSAALGLVRPGGREERARVSPALMQAPCVSRVGRAQARSVLVSAPCVARVGRSFVRVVRRGVHGRPFREVPFRVRRAVGHERAVPVERRAGCPGRGSAPGGRNRWSGGVRAGVRGPGVGARCLFRRGCRILEVWSSSGTSRSSGRGGRRG